tara:strand:+ start:77 stop:307 length:231 start_codon:yes stop_codon:yes gene_type:complete
MSYLFVENEGDMELGLEYTISLAVGKSSAKTVDITFSSEGMMSIFMNNLFREFYLQGVPPDNGLNLLLHVPEDPNE